MTEELDAQDKLKSCCGEADDNASSCEFSQLVEEDKERS